VPSTLTHKPEAIKTAAAGSKGEVILTWSVHLFKQRPSAALRPVVCIVAVFVVALLLFRNALLALIPCAALVSSLSEYFLPIRYTLMEHSVKSRCGFVVLEMPWTDVRHAYLTDNGVKLSPLRAKNSRFESLRGIFLQFGDKQEEVVQTVRRLRVEANRSHE
jgi:hypothetical protein